MKHSADEVTSRQKLFGETIRDFRTRAGMSLFDLAFRMSWEGTSPLIAIEKGRRLPRPETITRIGDCLNLRHPDIIYLQGLAGYRPETTFPPSLQIKDILDDIASDTTNMYPTYVIDYQFRLWMVNMACLVYVNNSVEDLEGFVRNKSTTLRIVFDSRFPQFGSDQFQLNRHEIQKDQIYRFKSRNIFRRHEDFYLSYPSCMQSALLPDDFNLFEDLWGTIKTEDVKSYRIKSVVETNFHGVSIEFVTEEHPIPQLEDLFLIVSFYPEGNSENRKRCEEYFSSLGPSQGWIKTPDLTGA